MEPFVVVVVVIAIVWGAAKYDRGESDDHSQSSRVVCIMSQCRFVIIEREKEGNNDGIAETSIEGKEGE